MGKIEDSQLVARAAGGDAEEDDKRFAIRYSYAVKRPA